MISTTSQIDMDCSLQYQMYYFIEDNQTITAISSDNTIYSADFQIEDNTIVLTISHLEGDFEVYASLEKEKLPPVKKAAIKIIYRLVK